MTTETAAETTASQHTKPYRHIAAFMLLGVVGVQLLSSVLGALLGEGDFTSRAIALNMAGLVVLGLPLIAVLIATHVSPMLPQGKVITLIALVELGVAALFTLVAKGAQVVVLLEHPTARSLIDFLLGVLVDFSLIGIAIFLVLRVFTGEYLKPAQPAYAGYPQQQYGGQPYPQQQAYGHQGATAQQAAGAAAAATAAQAGYAQQAAYQQQAQQAGYGQQAGYAQQAQYGYPQQAQQPQQSAAGYQTSATYGQTAAPTSAAPTSSPPTSGAPASSPPTSGAPAAGGQVYGGQQQAGQEQPYQQAGQEQGYQQAGQEQAQQQAASQQEAQQAGGWPPAPSTAQWPPTPAPKPQQQAEAGGEDVQHTQMLRPDTFRGNASS
ncbi:MAG: hypothetical protein GEU94_11570 [Micromonosporaceae bacterium]|nr:hypothetical protein [Micromonosporaceae bacterium]